MQKATLEGAPFRGANTPPALSAGIPPQRRITASGYSPYQAHVPCRRPPWRGLRSVGRITPPALSAEIPPRRRITASGYSPYQAHVPHWKATLEGAPFRRANNATGVIRRHPAATADNRKRLFALRGPRAKQKGHPGCGGVVLLARGSGWRRMAGSQTWRGFRGV